MGLATIDLKRGTAPSVAPGESAPATGEVEIEESIFAFTKAPDQQVSKSSAGGSTGAKVLLSQPENGSKGNVAISIGDKNWTHDVAEHLGRDTPLEGSPFTLRVEAFWPDFRIDNGKPVSVSRAAEQSRGRRHIARPCCPGGGSRERAPCRTKRNGRERESAYALYRETARLLTISLRGKAGPLDRQAGREHAAHDRLGGLATRGRSHHAHADHWMEFAPATGDGAPANLPDGRPGSRATR
jgi:hypothetical protein